MNNLARLLLASAALLPAAASAALIAYDGLAYTSGEFLNAQSGGTGFSFPWNAATGSGVSWDGNMTISTGLAYAPLATTGNGALQSGFTTGTRDLSTTLSGVYWWSVLVSPQTPVAGSHNIQFAFRQDGTKKFFAQFNSAGNVNMAIETPFSAQFAGTYTDGSTYFLVGRTDVGTGTDGTLHLWLNPDPASLGGGAPDLATANASIVGIASSSLDSINRITFTDEVENGNVRFDEIRLGTTWADVTPIPEPAAWGVAFGALGLACLAARRRHA